MKSGYSEISRRDLVKLGGIAALGAMGGASLAGCSETTEVEPAGKTFVSLTAEERVAAVNNPVFMGGSHNKNGQEIKLTTLPNGGIAPEVCAEYDKQFDQQLVEVVPGKVYCSIGSTNANSVMVLGDQGFIIIDTAETLGTAQMDYEQFKTVPGVAERKPKAIIATHDHYFGGTAAYVGEGNPDNVPIIAHELFMACKYGAAALNAPSSGMRAMRQMGMMLPAEGCDALVGAGMGRFMSNPKDKEKKSGFIVPNTLIPDANKYTEMVIDGVRIQLWPLVSDSICSMDIWFPDLKLAVSNHVWNAFYNTYPLRGQVYRDPVDTINAIDVTMAWEPEYMCSCHSLPLIGAEECRREMMLYRDSLQFLYDQTIRAMNMGLAPDDVVRAVTFPDAIMESKCARPLYGDVEYYIRAVYGGLVGWFGNDAIELHPVSKEFESKKFIDAMGGVDSALEELRFVLEDSQWSWAATLAAHILRVDPDCAEAVKLKAAAFREMGYRSIDSSSRNWYLMEALRLEGKFELPWAGPMAMFAAGYATGEKNFFIRVLGININPDKAKGMNKTLSFDFVDTGDVETMAIHNCVAQSIRGAVDNPDVVLRMPFALIPAIGAGQTTVKAEIGKGTIELVGSEADLDAIVGVFDMPW